METVPHLFFRGLPFKELISKMVIPPEDERSQRYVHIPDDLFSQLLKQRGVKSVDRQLVRHYSSLIIQKLKELSKKVNRDRKG